MVGQVPLKIAYFGLPLGALALARAGHHPSVCVLSPVPAPGARRLRRTIEGPVLEAENLGSGLEARVREELAGRAIDLLVSWFWTRKLPADLIALARLGGVGAHPSLLPRHRGPDPYFWTLDCGDAETGVSIHRLEPEYDTGPILHQEVLAVGDRTAGALARALDGPSLRALGRVVSQIAAGRPVSEVPQDHARATQAPRPSGDLLRLDRAWSTERALRRIRALSPIPGLPLQVAGLDFFVTRASPAPRFTPALDPGEGEVSSSRILLRTVDGAIQVDEAFLVDGRRVSGLELATRLKSRG